MPTNPKLHEILAVEADLRQTAIKVTDECLRTFKDKATHFMKHHRRLKMFEQDNVEHVEENKEMVTTVADKLSYVEDHIIRYYDAVLQKELTNQQATADIKLPDGAVIAQDVPATFLLGLEEKLKRVRAIYEAIPTLQPGKKWEPDTDIGEHVFKNAFPEEKMKTKKVFAHQILVEPTDKHPAQIEKWEETKDVGKYILNEWSSMLTPARKSILLGRLDTLIQAIKKARQRANTTELVQRNIGSELFGWIHREVAPGR